MHKKKINIKKTIIYSIKLLIVLISTYLLIGGYFRLDNYVFIQEVHALQETLNTQRKKADPVELTAVTDKIIQVNSSLKIRQSFIKFDIFNIVFSEDFKQLKLVE